MMPIKIMYTWRWRSNKNSTLFQQESFCKEGEGGSAGMKTAIKRGRQGTYAVAAFISWLVWACKICKNLIMGYEKMGKTKKTSPQLTYASAQNVLNPILVHAMLHWVQSITTHLHLVSVCQWARLLAGCRGGLDCSCSSRFLASFLLIRCHASL